MENNHTEKLTEIISLVNDSSIASIKEVVGEILRALRDIKTGAGDLKEIIEKDPPLCAKLLKRANSAYYGYPRTISDIQEAVVCLGFDEVKSLALNQKACDLFDEDTVFEGFSRWFLWKHSVAVALCCKKIYRKIFHQPGDDLYVAGLLHDIGIIVEDQFFDYQFKSALKKAAEENLNLYDAEREFLSVDHAEIGRAIMLNWDFPDEMTMAIGYHHRPYLLKDKEVEREVLTLCVANRLCHKQNIGYIDAPHVDDTLLRDSIARLKISEEDLQPVVEELNQEIIKMEKMKWL
ncbi:MAG: HDOD domain-containing protein [Candidatus Glassbacteria bacterium]|nr:HDOD domain-containing protein [Candidatus Glassbacteria bacterium]